MRKHGFATLSVRVCVLALLVSMIGLFTLAEVGANFTCKNEAGTVQVTRYHVPEGVTCTCTTGTNYATIECTDGYYLSASC